MASAGSRRDARERALYLLYEAEAKGVPAADVVADLPMPPDGYVVTLLDAITTRGDEIDELLRRFLKQDWSMERLPSIDRSVLRMAIGELLVAEVPTGAVISEAVEVVKRYSTDDSSRFVNGVLSAIARDQAPR